MSSALLRDPAQPTLQFRARPESADGRSTDIARVLQRVESALSCDAVVASRVAKGIAEVLARECRTEVEYGRLAQWQIEKVDAYMRGNLDARLMVKELADQASLSVSHFGRAFKSTFGEVPRARIMRMRLDHARSLLRTTDMPLSEIALACGFSDQAHLCKRFRRTFGTTPSAWRRALSHASRRPSDTLLVLDSYELS